MHYPCVRAQGRFSRSSCPQQIPSLPKVGASQLLLLWTSVSLPQTTVAVSKLFQSIAPLARSEKLQPCIFRFFIQNVNALSLSFLGFEDLLCFVFLMKQERVRRPLKTNNSQTVPPHSSMPTPQGPDRSGEKTTQKLSEEQANPATVQKITAVSQGQISAEALCTSTAGIWGRMLESKSSRPEFWGLIFVVAPGISPAKEAP